MYLYSIMSFPTIPFNSLYAEDLPQDAPVRVPPSEQLDVAQPEQPVNSLEQKQTESADPPLAADDEDNLVVSEYVEGTRSDERQLAQKQGAAAQRETGGDRPEPKRLYDENGLLWVGPDGPEGDALPLGDMRLAANAAARATVSGLAQVATDPLTIVGGGLKDAVGDSIGNPLTDVAQGIGALGTQMTEGLVKQMNTMLIILGLAYVAGQAVSGKGTA